MEHWKTMRIFVLFCLQAFAHLQDEHNDLKSAKAKDTKKLLIDVIEEHDLDKVSP